MEEAKQLLYSEILWDSLEDLGKNSKHNNHQSKALLDFVKSTTKILEVFHGQMQRQVSEFQD